MNRIDRLSAILVQLQSRSLVKAQQIADRFEISLRTVYRDIRALEEAGIPVIGNSGVGYSLVAGFKLPPLMFTQAEAFAFLIAEKLVDELSDSVNNEHYRSGMDKIKAVMRFADKSDLETVESHVGVLKSYKSKVSTSSDLQAIMQSISKKRALKILYFADSRQEITERIIEPVGIFFSKENWYLIAFCRTRTEYRTFKINRIKNISDFDAAFTQHPPLRKFLDIHCQQQELQEITVKIKKEKATIMGDDKYYYGLFAEKEAGEYIEYSFLVFSLEKFARWYLSFADFATIIKPVELKETVKKIWENIRM